MVMQLIRFITKRAITRINVTIDMISVVRPIEVASPLMLGPAGGAEARELWDSVFGFQSLEVCI